MVPLSRATLAITIALVGVLAAASVLLVAAWWLAPLMTVELPGRPTSVRELIAAAAFAGGRCQAGAVFAPGSELMRELELRCLEETGEEPRLAQRMEELCSPLLARSPHDRYVPLYRQSPEYPFAARKTGTEGWVHVRLWPGPSGRVQRQEVVDADPAEVFEAASLTAVANWRYCINPEGDPPKGGHLEIMFPFQMEGDPLRTFERATGALERRAPRRGRR